MMKNFGFGQFWVPGGVGLGVPSGLSLFGVLPRAQYPLNKEYALNHNIKAPII